METITLNKNEIQIVDERPSHSSDTFEFKTRIDEVLIDNKQFEKYIDGKTPRYLDSSPTTRTHRYLKLMFSSIVVILAVTLGSSYYAAITSAPATSVSHLQAPQTIIVHSNTVSQP